MDDAALQAALGIHCLNRLHHTAQTVGTEQINIQNSTAFEVIQHAQPKFATLMLTDPYTQNVFSTVQGDAQNHMSNLGHVAVILFDFVVDGIHEDEGVDAFQRTVLPGVDLRHNYLTDLPDQLRGDLHIVLTLDLLSNIPLAHAAGINDEKQARHFSLSILCTDHSCLNVPTDEFFDTKHTLPTSLSEQRKIADFLIVLDRRIAAQQALVENLKKYKRGAVRTLLTPESCKIEGAKWNYAQIGELQGAAAVSECAYGGQSSGGIAVHGLLHRVNT